MIKRKICLLGSFGVGKTSLVKRFVDGIFSERYLSTVGVKIDRRILEFDTGEVTLLVWDIAGEEEFQRFHASYLRGAHGVMAVADGTRAETLNQACGHLTRALEIAPRASSVFLLNKDDLESEWEIDETVEDELDPGLPRWRTSAKTGDNVEQAFSTLAIMTMHASAG